MSRISETLRRLEPELRPVVESLSTLDENDLREALEEISACLEDSGLSWKDIACVLFECPKRYDELREKVSATAPKKPKSYSQGKLQEGEWKRAATGSLRGMVNGSVCTIFPSKRNDGTFCSVINIAGGEAQWDYDFNTEEDAKDYLTRTYG